MGLQLEQFDNKSFDRGASRWKEFAWRILKFPILQLPLPLPSFVRVWVLRLFGAKVGRGVVIRAGVNISFPWRLSLGDYVWIGEEVTILSLAPVTIGSHCCISQQVFLCTGSHDFSKPTFDLIVNPIVIENGCWLAARVFVAPGVTFRTGSMAAASAVVLKEVQPGTMVGGNPAKYVKRFGAASVN